MKTGEDDPGEDELTLDKMKIWMMMSVKELDDDVDMLRMELQTSRGLTVHSKLSERKHSTVGSERWGLMEEKRT